MAFQALDQPSFSKGSQRELTRYPSVGPARLSSSLWWEHHLQFLRSPVHLLMAAGVQSLAPHFPYKLPGQPSAQESIPTPASPSPAPESLVRTAIHRGPMSHTLFSWTGCCKCAPSGMAAHPCPGFWLPLTVPPAAGHWPRLSVCPQCPDVGQTCSKEH